MLLNFLDIFRISKSVLWKDLPSYYFTFYLYNPKKLIGIRIRNLAGTKIYVRRGSIIDRDVIKYVFCNQYHLPLQELPDKSIILDLGSNIGLTLIHFKKLYPGANVFGFEMDRENFEIALHNISGLQHCWLFNEAVWTKNGEVKYSETDFEDGFNIINDESIPAKKKLKVVQATTIDQIILEHSLTRIDYLKMDIEGAEKNIFTETSCDWLDIVQQLNIEGHDATFLGEIIKILQMRGFICLEDKAHKSLVRAYRNKPSCYQSE